MKVLFYVYVLDTYELELLGDDIFGRHTWIVPGIRNTVKLAREWKIKDKKSFDHSLFPLQYLCYYELWRPFDLWYPQYHVQDICDIFSVFALERLELFWDSRQQSNCVIFFWLDLIGDADLCFLRLAVLVTTLVDPLFDIVI